MDVSAGDSEQRRFAKGIVMWKLLAANFIAFGFCASFVSSQAFGQVVQLPTFHTFSIGTTVSIPDRGSMTPGGVDRARFGRNEFGVPGLSGIPGAGRLFGNRAIGAQVESSRVNATATIMDLQELDRAVLGQAASQAPATDPAVARKAAFLAQHIGRNQKQAALESTPALATHANERAPRVADAETEAREAYALAQQAEARGQFASARVQYKIAATRTYGPLRAVALARLSALMPTTKNSDSSTR
jgi:hypothetical protein